MDGHIYLQVGSGSVAFRLGVIHWLIQLNSSRHTACGSIATTTTIIIKADSLSLPVRHTYLCGEHIVVAM